MFHLLDSYFVPTAGVALIFFQKKLVLTFCLEFSYCSSKFKYLIKRNEPFKCQSYKMVKYTQTIRGILPKSCLSVFDHFVGLALKGS